MDHWLLYNIPYNCTGLQEGQNPIQLGHIYENGIVKSLSFVNSTNVLISVLKNEEIVLMYESGLAVHIFIRYLSDIHYLLDVFLSQWIALPKNYRLNETLIGLLGNANDNPNDDWQTKLGVTCYITNTK